MEVSSWACLYGNRPTVDADRPPYGMGFTEDSLLGVNTHTGLLLSTPIAGKSDVLTDGSFGPDGSVWATIVGVSFCPCILLIKAKPSSIWFEILPGRPFTLLLLSSNTAPTC